MDVAPKWRMGAVLLYGLLLCLLQATLIKGGLRPDERSIWLYNGLASLLFGSRILNPYFTPPVDAAMNAFAALASLIAAALAVQAYTTDAYILGATIGFASLVFVLAFFVLMMRPAPEVQTPLYLRALDRIVRQLGSPNVIFTVVIVVAVWLFHRDSPTEMFAILGTFSVVTLLRPIESVASYGSWFRGQLSEAATTEITGTIAAYQAPGIVLIRQTNGAHVDRGATLLVAGEEGDWLLGVALNYVGRDEGNLLRVLTAPLPKQLNTIAASNGVSASQGVALTLSIPAEEAAEIPALEWVNRLCGIVDSDTTFEQLRFEVIDERGLSEGRLVEARIAEHRSVLFQLVQGVTHEEIVQQKNKYGYVRAGARKIGRWDAAQSKFCHVPWLPKINSPVFLRETGNFEPDRDAVGHFPGTPYGVTIDISQAVTHNTAILGILGVGKSYLAIELVERMIAAGIKVLCLDLTNQYELLLADFFDPLELSELRQVLVAAGANGQPNQNRELGGSRRAFKQAVTEQLRQFMNPATQHKLRVFNPAQFEVTKQQSGMFNNNAELMTLTASEVTGIFSDAALAVCQELGMTDQARLCLVYEEAHSLVPEWNSVAAEGDKQATAVSARAILQGRKYGLGCLLITQRTANVTKTILNQCNTIFAMRTFDETGKEFLSNYIGADYSSLLPSLEPRHAVFFGRASCCENPVLLKLNDRADFIGVFRNDQADVLPAEAAGEVENPPAQDLP